MSQRETTSGRWLRDLADAAPGLAQQSAPKPYYSQRHGGQTQDPPVVSLDAVVVQVAHLLRRLLEEHYFARLIGYECVDGGGEGRSTLEIEFTERIGRPDLADLRSPNWSPEEMYEVIEVFHDLAARPTNGWFHSYSGCGWHPNRFHIESGQALYRWEVNRVLSRSSLGVRLADHGEDIGRIVFTYGTNLDDLASSVVEDSVGDERLDDRVRHAVAAFRARSSTRESRREAVTTLAGILERYRTELKRELGKDENALLNIANNFDLRHNTTTQRHTYGDEFLEWIYHWYLGTIRLLQHLNSDTPV